MIEDLENRVRELASEVGGEKAITRQIYQQAVRNGDALRAVQVSAAEITSRVDHAVQELIQNTAAVRTHGARLDSLTRDVALVRGDVTALRRGQEELHTRLDGVDRRLDERFDALERQMDERFAAVLEALRGLASPPSPPA